MLHKTLNEDEGIAIYVYAYQLDVHVKYDVVSAYPTEPIHEM